MKLKQEDMIIAEYEQEFVRLSKYPQELVSTEAVMCTCSEWRLNKNILMLVGALELKEFVVLSERAQKMEDMWNEKKQAKSKIRESEKRNMTKLFVTPPANVAGIISYFNLHYNMKIKVKFYF